MFNLSLFGTVHTLISLIAVGAGIIGFLCEGGISPKTQVGRIYVVTTVLTAVTALFIFHHGGFNKAHVISILTLVLLGVAAVADKKSFGAVSPYMATISYSTTFLFHMIAGITETSTRLPVGAPLVASPEAPALQSAIGVVFVLFVIGVVLQVLRLRRTLMAAP